MEESILKTVKKILGIPDGDTSFDLDVLTHINTAFSTLSQLGVGPAGGYMIEDETPTWDEFIGTDLEFNSVKTYVCLRVRMLFDPPATSFAIDAMKNQIQELEWRLNVHREETDWVDPDPPPVPEPYIVDPGWTG